MRSFGKAFAKEFWSRLLWYCAFGHLALLFLYVTASTIQI